MEESCAIVPLGMKPMVEGNRSRVKQGEVLIKSEFCAVLDPMEVRIQLYLS
jgi:hypothetical protein